MNEDPLQNGGVFDTRVDTHKLDFVKLKYRQEVDRMTSELIDQVGKSDLGRQVLKENKQLISHKYVADIAVAKIS
jgi:hypothetical protein